MEKNQFNDFGQREGYWEYYFSNGNIKIKEYILI
jgi:hypothetical protein